MKRPHTRQEGSVSIIVALSMVVLAGFGALAVDYGFLQQKRSQLQTAADMAALAGASTFLANGEDQNAIKTAALDMGRKNLGSGDSPDLALTASDVSLLKDGAATAETPDAIEVVVGRTAAKGNPVDLFLASVLGRDQSDVSAVARAELFCSDRSQCLKPLAPPAKFTWDDSCDSKKKYKDNGQLDYDSACELASVQTQGYGTADVGTEITLKMGANADTAVNGHYNPVDYPAVNKGSPVPGANEYRDNLAGCTGSNKNSVAVGDVLQVEPGNMAGPTRQGIQSLIDEDPGAYWDSGTNSIKGSSYEDPMQSPRVAALPFYDPSVYQPSGRSTVVVYQLGAVFVEGVNNQGDVSGRFIRAMADGPQRFTGACDPDSFGLYGASLSLDSSRMR